MHEREKKRSSFVFTYCQPSGDCSLVLQLLMQPFTVMGKSAKIARKNFRKCDEMLESPDVLVADYVFDDCHEESDVSWLFRKLDRYKNGSSFTSNSWTTGKEDTPKSRHICVPVKDTESPTCKKALWKSERDDSNDIGHSESFVPFNGVCGPKLSASKIASICGKLRKGSTSSKCRVEESTESSSVSPSATSSKS